MAALHRLIAVYLLLVGVAVAGYFIAYPLYAGQGNPDHAHDVWEVLNWFMAVATVLLTLITCTRMQALGEGAATWDRLVANGRFYLAVALLLGFFSNWFSDQWGPGPTPFLWVVVDIGLPILAAEMALTLWRDPDPA